MRGERSSRNRDFFHGDIPHSDQLSEVGEEESKLRRIALNKLDTRVGIVESVGFHGITKERGEELSIGHLFHACIITQAQGEYKNFVAFIFSPKYLPRTTLWSSPRRDFKNSQYEKWGGQVPKVPPLPQR